MKSAAASGALPALIEDGVPSRAVARDVAIDSIRGLAILMVIGIHSLQQPLGALGTAIDAALRPAVPIFLFLSGYLTGRSGQLPLLKRIRAALVPYTIAFAAAYIYMAAHNPAMDHRPLTTLGRYGLGYVFVYYYVPIYIACNVLLWGMFRVSDPLKQPMRLCIALAIAAVFGIVAGSYLDPLMATRGISSAVIEEARIRDILFWFSFVAIGAIVGIVRAEASLRQSLAWIVLSAGAAYAIYAAARVFDIGDAAPYDSSAFLLYAVCLALTLLAWNRGTAFLAFAGSGSYFIYLWHIFVIMALRDHTNLASLGGFMTALATYITTAAVSFAALLAVRQLLPPRAVQWMGAR